MENLIEYRVRPVTRYILTRYESTENCGSSCVVGEYERADTAWVIGCALARRDEDFPCVFGESEVRVIHPTHPDHTDLKSGYSLHPF